MAHVQRKCGNPTCRSSVPPGGRTCPSCGGRDWSYVARYRAPDGAERSRSFERKADAETFLHDQETRKQRGEWMDPALGRTPFGGWADKVEAGRVNRRASTVARDASVMRSLVLPRYRDLPLAAISPADVRAWIAELTADGYAAATVRKAYQLLEGVLEAAVGDGLVPRSPCRGVELPKLEGEEMRFLSPAEVGFLAESIGRMYRPLVLAAAYTGLRFGELAALRPNRMDLLRRTLRVEESLNEVRGRLLFGQPKTKASRRSVSLPVFLVDVLAEHLAAHPPEGGLVFTSPEGAPLRRNAFRRRVWRRAVSESVGEPCRFHDLRHSHAAMLIAEGVHPKVLQERLGHASIRTTLDTYGHLFEGLDEAAAERLDATFRLSAAGPPRDTGGTIVQLPAPMRLEKGL